MLRCAKQLQGRRLRPALAGAAALPVDRRPRRGRAFDHPLPEPLRDTLRTTTGTPTRNATPPFIARTRIARSLSQT